MVPSPDLGLIFDIRRFSIHDGPGIRTVVFFKGCPLSCWWCHNPEGQSHTMELWWRKSRCLHCSACVEACPNDAIFWQGDKAVTDEARCDLCGACVEVCPAEARQIVGRWMSVEQVLEELEKDRPFYDESGGGVTFSGGEPLAQPRFLLTLLKACRERELHTALDTCGFASWETLNSVRPYVDLFLYDLKLMDDRAHQKYTGASNRQILSNLRRLAELGHRLLLRLPLIPGISDDVENLRQLGEFVRRLPGRPEVELLPYHSIAIAKYERLNIAYKLEETSPPSPEALEQVERVLKEYGFQVHLGTGRAG